MYSTPPARPQSPNSPARAPQIQTIKGALARWAAWQMYLNFAETQHPEAPFWTKHAYQRLRQIKANVDPGDMIRSNHPIPPAKAGSAGEPRPRFRSAPRRGLRGRTSGAGRSICHRRCSSRCCRSARHRSLIPVAGTARGHGTAGRGHTGRPPFEARLATIIPAIGQLADGIAAANEHDRQRIQYRSAPRSHDDHYSR